MGKSINEYYAEKMQKLLEKQSEEKRLQLASPGKRRDNSAPAATHSGKTDNSRGRNYYESFRKDTSSEAKEKYTPPKSTTETGEKKKTGDFPKKDGTSRQTPKRISPEQTGEDKRLEEQRREYADLRAKRGRKLRKVRDALISVFLVLAVATLLCIVVYRLVFVVSTINVNGAEKYNAEEIIKASGISEGEHLYSFRNSVAENLITVRCPAVGTAQVDKVAPSTVNLNITEEKTVYYADFYGELRQMSESLRVLYAITPQEACEQGLIRLYLPLVSEALSGKCAVYSGVRNDSYIYELTSDVAESSLGEGVKSIDMRNKYDLSMNYNDRFLIKLGDSESLKTKLKLAFEIINDSMFDNNNDKARINVSDLSVSGVTIDNKLVLN